MHGNTLNAYHKKWAIDFYIDPEETLKRMKAEEQLTDEEIQEYREYADKKNPANRQDPATDKRPKETAVAGKTRGVMKSYDIWMGKWEVDPKPGPHLKGKRTFTSENDRKELIIWVFAKTGDKPLKSGVRMEPFRADDFNYSYQMPAPNVAVQQMFEVEEKKQ